jgi:hypothetical protein
LMLLIRTHQQGNSIDSDDATPDDSAPSKDQDENPSKPAVLSLEHKPRTWHAEGRSHRSMARDLNIDRRKVKQVIDQAECSCTHVGPIHLRSDGASLACKSLT